jgi:hypothetical protein
MTFRLRNSHSACPAAQPNEYTRLRLRRLRRLRRNLSLFVGLRETPGDSVGKVSPPTVVAWGYCKQADIVAYIHIDT